ncbi:MAG TPA: hypothetical protein VJ807_01125, partial [Gaiellaceae bacterium]|nr:hypothetical protein [Gaiellaceae bacterium]
LRAGGTQAQAASAAGVKSVSTIKRWLDDPEFRAMVRSSPDIRAGAPPRIGEKRGVLESQRGTRENVFRLIDPAILERACQNDAAAPV